MGQVGKYFKASEFACPCCNKTNPSALLVTILDSAREVLGPLRVNSGYRCKEYNASPRIGGSSKSWHVPRGGVSYAADVTYSDPIKRHGEHILRLYIEIENAARRHGVAYGLGLYGGGWVHVDTRGELGAAQARWFKYSWPR